MVERDVLLDKRAEHVDDGAERDRPRRVQVSVRLEAGAGKVKRRRSALAVDIDLQLQRGAVVHVVLGFEGESAELVGHTSKEIPNHPLCVILDSIHVFL